MATTQEKTEQFEKLLSWGSFKNSDFWPYKWDCPERAAFFAGCEFMEREMWEIQQKGMELAREGKPIGQWIDKGPEELREHWKKEDKKNILSQPAPNREEAKDIILPS